VRFILFLFLFFFPLTLHAEDLFEGLLVRALVQLELDGPIDEWTSRARASAFLPKVVIEGSGGRRWDANSREKSNFFRDDKGDLLHEWTQAQVDSGRDEKIELSLRLRWNFGNTLFHSDEMAIESRRAKRRDQKLSLFENLATRFAQWKALEKNRKKGTLDEKAQTKLSALEFYFDAISGGWFLKNKGKGK